MKSLNEIFTGAEWNKTFGFGKYTFTLAELRDLLISAAVLGIIFTFRNWSLTNFLISIAVVGPALIFHELAHKLMAQKYDLVAAYVMWPTGIAIALMVSFVTGGRFIFAALGAVMISSVYHTRLGYRFIGLTSDQMGKIAAVGPLTNISLAIIAYILMPLAPAFFGLAAYINLIIALFNCLPFPPLDGTKIFRWNISIWLGILGTAVVLWILPNLIGIWFSIIIAIVLLIIIVIGMQKFIPVGQQSQTEFR